MAKLHSASPSEITSPFTREIISVLHSKACNNLYIYHAKSRLNTPVWGSLCSPNNLYRESRLNKPESVSLASLARQLETSGLIVDTRASSPPLKREGWV